MPLTISPSMPLDQLAERMSTDIEVRLIVAVLMRALLVEHAPAHGWETTDDVGEAEWLRLLNLADEVETPDAEWARRFDRAGAGA